MRWIEPLSMRLTILIIPISRGKIALHCIASLFVSLLLFLSAYLWSVSVKKEKKKKKREKIQNCEWPNNEHKALVFWRIYLIARFEDEWQISYFSYLPKKKKKKKNFYGSEWTISENGSYHWQVTNNKPFTYTANSLYSPDRK